MGFPLGIFGTDTNASTRFDPAQLSAWLDSLPPLDASWFLQEVLSSLVSYREIDVKPRQRLAALNVYRNKVEQVNNTIDRNLTQRVDDTSTHLYRVLAELVDGYAGVVANEKSGRSSVKVSAIYFEMELLIQEMLLAYRLYGPVPHHIFQRIYSLYRLAETAHALYEPVSGLGTNKAQTIGELFKQYLLTCITDPFHMADGEVSQLFEGMRRYTQSLALSDQLAQQDREALFYIDTDADRAPEPLEPDDALPTGNILFLDLGQVITDISRERQNEHLSHAHHLHFEQGARLLKQILPRFRGRTARRSKRESQNRPVAVIASLSELISCLDSRTEKPALPEHMRVINESQHGFCLQYDGNGIHFQVGETVAIYRFNGNKVQGPPLLGFTRWMRRSSDHDVQLGVETVAGTPAFATVHGPDDDHASNAVLLSASDHQHLILPETCQWHTNARLVLHSADFNGVVELAENASRAQLSAAWSLRVISEDPS